MKSERQNYTDLEKGIRFCFSIGYSCVIISCALGGTRTDHTIGNLFLLRKMRKEFPEKTLTIETKNEIIEFFDEVHDALKFNCNIGDKFGIFGINEARVKSQGLKWELDSNYPLTIGFQDGHCNITNANEVFLKVLKGEVLVIRSK